MVFRHAAAGLSLAVLAVFAPAVSRAAAPPVETPCPKALAGGTDAYDFRADLRAVYQYYCHNHPKPDEEQYPLWSGLAADSKMTHDELAARMKECTGVGLPKDKRSAAQQQNLDNILNVIRIPERTLVSHMSWATFLFRDLVQKRLDGRNPFTNEGVHYTGSTDDAALNAGVVRFRADPKAVAMLADDSDMTGQIAIPVVTMHAIDDPTAMVEQEAHYRAVVEKAGHGDLLVQTFTDEHVHSKLHDAEYPAMLNALMQWITAGKKPTPAGIAASCAQYQAVYGGLCAFRPDYHPAAFSTRVYPRRP